jgi:hypothetical protein
MLEVDTDIHELARGSLKIQASLDLKLGKYYLKKSEIGFPFTFTHVQARGVLPFGF